MSTSTGLNVIALISGGKDSLYTLLHCIRNGHKVVALANLHPPLTNTSTAEKVGEDDIDSFMYQTVGWGVIPLYESALGIPLYRAPITGGAVDTARVYRDDTPDTHANSHLESESGVDGRGEEDETEALIPLLKKVMSAHPEANAICAGAILSTYQRTRIEDVAGRLGLTPLAWLWMYPFLPSPQERSSTGTVSEAGLLEDMASVGCSARIIKVASGALDEEFLWGDISEANGVVRRKIANGMRRFVVGDVGEDIRGAVLGEGGEYETLALDGPGFLWKGRIEIGDVDREVRRGEGGVAYLRLRGARCVCKVTSSGEGVGDGVTPEQVRRPALLDQGFAAALDGLDDFGEGEEEATSIVQSHGWTLLEPVQAVNGGLWTVSNITAPEAGPGAGEQMAAIAEKVQAVLDTADRAGPRTTADIVFTTVLLRSMADFPLMNSIYVSLFRKPNPPARATVACGDSLPDGVNVMISMVVDLGQRAQRRGLHVQSRSYWAPANIGPYSQAMSIRLQRTERVIYIAGQIPLEPASMDLIESGVTEPSWSETYRIRAVLSLQHMWRIGVAMEVGWWLGTVAFFTGTDHIRAKARLAWGLWEKMHDESTQEPEQEEESILDVWDIKYGRRGHEQTKAVTGPRFPDFELVGADELNRVPPFFAVQVHELPRNSDIEWQGLGYRCEGVRVTRKETEFGHTTDVTTNENLSYSCVELDHGAGFDLQSRLKHILEAYTVRSGYSHCVLYSTQPISQGCWPGQVVPCKSVWGAEGRELAAGLIIQRQS